MMKKILTLRQWIIEKTDGETYRAGRLQGEKHPCVDQPLLNQLGGMKNLLEQAQEMERDPELMRYIRFDWRDMGRDIRKIHYSVEIMPLLCEREGIEDPCKKQIRHIETLKNLLEEVSKTGTNWLFHYYNDLLKRLKQGKIVKEMEDENWFACFNAIARIQKPVWKRIFSAKVLHGSKKFETIYEDRVVKTLRDYSELADKDAMDNEQILKAYGIISYAQTLE